MKNINIYLLLLGFLLVLSCSKDKSNYDYSEKEHIDIEGIESKYTVISLKDTLKIFPTAKSNKDGELEYKWGFYETNVQGRAEPMDTIAHSQNLSYFITEDAKDWVVVCIVKNKKTGYSQYKTATVTVSTQFTRGWYVLKDDENNADLDLYLTPQNNLVSGKIENVYSAANNQKIEGKGNFISFSSSYKSNILNPSTYSNTRALFITTEKDIQTVNVNNLKKIRDKQNLFLGGAQQITGNTGAFLGSTANYLLNNGQLYNIYAMSVNTGQFGNKAMLDGNNSSYELSKYMISSGSNDPILFDNLGGNFTTLGNGYGSTMTIFSNDAANDLSTTNNNQKALFLGMKSNVYLPAPDYYYKTVGYAILQDKTDPTQKSLCALEKKQYVLSIKKEAIDPSSKLYNASLHTLLLDDENLMYFVNNNQLYSRNLSNGFEQQQFNAPGGEQITFIKHLKYSESGYAFNFVIVGTKLGSSYKIRMFTKSSGNLDSTPVQTLEGKGTARAIIYIAPAVSDYTYPSSY
ncbi:PKD-like family lipoprotein [Sphingobacterium sp.]|uniref:PKD-like family lipoprotein n=1 Tax=Sphingobacterium sp. TaxID=341027 RepID=UPI0031DB6C5B